MAALSYEDIKKQVQADREQKSKQVAQGISYEDIKKTVQGKKLLNSAQIYTLERDNGNLLTEIQNVFNNWQDPQTIQKTINSLPKMMKRMENYKNYLADYYTGQDKQAQVQQIEKQIEDYTELSDLLQQQASFYSEYKNADEYENAKRISGYYKEYENSSYEEVQNSLSELKKQKGFYTVKGYDKEAQDIDKKIQWLENFYNNGYDKAPIEWRKEQYRQNENEIARLEIEIKEKKKLVPEENKIAGPHKETEAEKEIRQLIAQRNALMAENNVYDRSKGLGDNAYLEYLEVSSQDDFDFYVEKGKSLDNGKKYVSSNSIIQTNPNRVAAENYIPENASEELKLSLYANNLYLNMTKEEELLYNYYLGKEGEDSANAFLKKITPELERRKNFSSEEQLEFLMGKEGWEGTANTILFNVGSIPANIIGKPLAFLDNSVRQIAGQEISPYSKWQNARNFANDVRETTSEQIEQSTNSEFLGKNVMAKVYNALMSSADSIAGAFTMGNLYTIAMGAGAAADKSAELYEKGASNSQIFWGGLSAGVAETVFEKVSLENLIKPKNPDSFFKIVLEVFKQAGIEGSEEIATEIANTITDSIIMGSQSDLSLAVKAYQEDGLSYEEAYKKALIDKVVDISWAGISGMMAGGISSSIVTGYGSAKNVQIGNNIKKLGNSNALIDFAIQNYSKDTQAYKMAERLSNNKNNSALALGSLYMTMKQQNQTDFSKASDVSAKEIQPMLEKSGIEAPQTSSMAKNIAKDIQSGKLNAKDRQQLTNNPAAKTVYDSVRAEVENKKETIRTKERMLDAIVNVNIKTEINETDNAQNLDNLSQVEYTNSRNNIRNEIGNTAVGNAQAARKIAASNSAGSPQPASARIEQKNNRGNAVSVNRGEGYARTAEFRELQEASRGMPDEISALYHSGERTLDEGLRRRISTVLKRQLDVSGSSAGNGDGILTLTAKGNTFHLHQQVDGALFHDVFEIAKSYLKNGELVDLHGIQTTEDGIGYDDCDNYLSDDGLSGFSITPDGDLISVFNASGKKGFLNAIASIVKERAKTLDCYNSPTQPLLEIYEKTFGFKPASVMDYNMEYDHDNIAANHDNPQVAFMVNTDQEVETKHFDKNQYEEAKAYRDQYVEQAAQEAASFILGEPVITERSAENPEPDMIADTVYAVRGETRLTDDQRVIRRIGNRLGWTIEFGKVQTVNGMHADGKIDKANKVITISTENTRPIAFIFKHELAHRGEGTKQYTELVKTISQTKQYESWLEKNTGMKSTVDRMEAALNEEIRQRYDTAGESISVAEARAELMADFMGDMLFADESGMNRLLQELELPKRRSLLQWIKDALNYIRSKLGNADSRLTAELERLEQQYARMLKDSEALNDNKKNGFPSSSKTTLSQGNTAINSINQDELSVNSIIFKNAKNDTKEAQDYRSDETDIIRAKDGIKYSIAKSYKQQVDDVLNNNYDKNNHVYMGNTPSKLVQVLGLPDLPMLATNNHIYSMSVSEQQAKQEGRYKKGTHYHDLGAIVKDIPKLLNEPVLLIKSNTRADDATVVAVTSAVDKNGFPVMAAIKPNGKGNYCDVEIDANIMLSGYGKENIQNYVQTAGEEGRILYADKKSNQQHNPEGVQFPNNIMTADYNNSLARYRQSVNSIIFKNAKNDTKETQYSIPADYTQKYEEVTDQRKNGEITEEEYIRRIGELFAEAGKEHGTIAPGEEVTGKENFENPVPQSVKDGTKVRRHVRTIIEGGKLTDEMMNTVKQQILSGDISYTPISNDQSLKKAQRDVERGDAERIWENAVKDNKISDEAIAVGETMLALAIERKDAANVVKLTAELSEVGTRTGQALQAMKLLKRMDGISQLVFVQRAVQTLNKDLETRYKRRFGVGKDDKGKNYRYAPVEINPTLAEQLAESKTAADFEISYGAIMRDLAAQVPSTFLDKWNAWRYMAMLANPVTMVRNLVGNAIFVPAVKMKNMVASALETVIIKEESQRTKALIVDKKYKEFAANDFDEMSDIVTGNGKYNPKRTIADQRRVFKTDVLEGIRRGYGNALEGTDKLFLKRHYITALGSFLQARKADINNISPKLLSEARQYAILEAQKATYRDASAIANAIQRFSNSNKAANIATEALLPFKKTPVNILKRGIEYSPVGLVKILTKGIYDVRNGNISLSQFCDGLASGLTGTGIMAVGMLLSSLGVITVGFVGDDDELWRKLNGEQEYAIQIGDVSYTLDWAAPACIPFFIGAAIMEQFTAEDNNSGANIIDSVIAGMDVITELSMLSGMNDVINSVRYGKKNGLVSISSKMVSSYFSQALPTVGGKIANTFDDTSRINYIDKTSNIPTWLQSAMNMVESKVPGLSQTRPADINAWGEKENTGSWMKRFFQNFISPGYLSTVEENEITEELTRLAKATGNPSVLPDSAPKYFSFKGTKKNLSAEEYQTYATVRGQRMTDYVSEAVKSAEYKKLTDAQKAKVIKNLYGYANAYAKASLIYSYEEIRLMNVVDITEERYNRLKDKDKMALAKAYFLDGYEKVFVEEKNGGSAVEYYIKKERENETKAEKQTKSKENTEDIITAWKA